MFAIGVTCGAAYKKVHLLFLKEEIAMYSLKLAELQELLQKRNVAVDFVSTTTALVGVQAAKMTINGFIAGVVTACVMVPVRRWLMPGVRKRVKNRSSFSGYGSAFRSMMGSS